MTICSTKRSGKLTYHRMIKNRDNESIYSPIEGLFKQRDVGGRLYLGGRIYMNGKYCSRMYLNGGFKEWANKAKNTLKNVAKKGYSVFKKVYEPVKKVLKSDFVQDTISAIHPGIKKGLDIGMNVIDSVEKAIDNKSLDPIKENKNIMDFRDKVTDNLIDKTKQLLFSETKQKTDEMLDNIKELSENPKSGILKSDYEFAKQLANNIDYNLINKMRHNMKGNRLVKEMVNNLLVDRNENLRSGRLKIDDRYRKLFNIGPYSVKNRLNTSSMNEKVQNKGGKINSKTKFKNEVKNNMKNNDLYNILYGLN